MLTRTNDPLLHRLASPVLERFSQVVPWHKQPLTASLLTLWALRNRLRRLNLYSTAELAPPQPGPATTDGNGCPSAPGWRTVDGTRNDPNDPGMGSVGRRFGRNVPLDKALPERGSALMTPNPREVSRRLLARDFFKPATTLNLLAAAWIQFQIHDWFEHDLDMKHDHEVPIDARDNWPHKPMRVPRLRCASPGVAGKEPPTYINRRTHWWDASQLYGTTEARTHSLRTHQDGKLLIGPDGLLPVGEHNIDRTGMISNWWLGLSLLHTLFTLEHNAICDRLKKEYPHLNDEQLFRHAMLVNCALMAKIHTIEWTPAILGHPALELAMNANWTGVASQKVSRLLKKIDDPELQHGILHSPTDHFGVEYAMTEEFASVYRMHPLIPDNVHLLSLSDARYMRTTPISALAGSRARDVYREHSIQDLFYSFGVAHPGALTLHNYPDFLRELEPTPPDEDRPVRKGPLDLATIDILRDRERGVPRYNDFREALRLPRAKSFAQLTRNPTWQKELEEVYGNVDRVDLMVGMYAEEPPKGFGFSDTAFRIFILMASRRLKSDRFFTDEYTETNYTRAGLDWVNENTMRTVLMRHYPELTPVLQGMKNAFAPWSV